MPDHGRRKLIETIVQDMVRDFPVPLECDLCGESTWDLSPDDYQHLCAVVRVRGFKAHVDRHFLCESCYEIVGDYIYGYAHKNNSRFRKAAEARMRKGFGDGAPRMKKRGRS